MDHFSYKGGRLMAEDVALADIAAAAGTPCYVYSTATLTRHYTVFAEALAGLDAQVFYAVKANGNIAVIGTLAALGAGADVVSGGELERALAAGVPPERIVFSGIGKTEPELARALDLGIHQINVESIPELELLDRVARARGAVADIAIRVNPDVDAKTHAKITTGKRENKFGIDIDRAHEVYGRAAALAGVRAVGVAMHIGSQLTDLAPYRAAYARAAELVRELREAGHDIDRLDLGGGLGIPYAAENPPSPAEYGEMVKATVGNLGCALAFEPGRMIAGNAGVLLSRVVYVKEGANRRFLILDAAMNDLIRPALYDAYHEVVPVTEPAAGAERAPADIVGPVCETGDTFAKERPMPPLAAGDLVAFRSAGAYGAVMASTYNARDLVPEALVNGEAFEIVAKRLTVTDMLARERLPAWLGAEARREAGE